MYFWMVAEETFPAVDTKNDRVHIDGIRRRLAYFSLKILEVGDLGFADFLLKAQWMAKKLGKDLVKIDCWEPTTKTCHLCGYRQDMPLNMRTFVCGGCGNIECRDVNAAHNILEAGRRLEVGRHQ